jgi:predicted MFS family arabinose efflux permease
MPESEAEEEDTPLRERVTAGLTYIRGNLTLKRLIVTEALALTFFSLVVPIEVVYAKDSLGVGDVGYGVLLSSWGAGMVGGSVVFAVLRRASLPLLFFVSTIAIGASYLGMAAAQSLAVACVAAIVGGTGNGVHWVVAVSAVQELTPQSMQVRTIGTLESIASAAPGVSYVAGGLIASAWDPRATFVVAGAGVLAVVAVMAPLLGYKWLVRPANADSKALDGGNEIVLELLPGGRPVHSDSEVLS